MKLNKWVLYFGSILPLITAACSADAPVEVDADQGLVEINLNGGIGKVTSTAVSRAALDGMINGKDTWSDDLTVSFARADASSSGTYTNFAASALTADVKKTPDAANGNAHPIKFSSSVYYLANGKNTKLIGWYPAVSSGVVFNSTDHTVTIDAEKMNGETDYLVTDMAEGNKVEASQIKSVKFKHLLMQISVKVYAETTDIRDIWGNIKSVSIDGLKQKCVITLPAATDAASGATAEAKVNFTDADPKTGLTLVKKDFGNNYAAINWPLEMGTPDADASKIVGYAMFAPQGTNDIKLTVETTTGGTQNPTVKAPEGGFLAGHSYIVVLKFGATDITPTVTIADWAEGTNPDEVII